MGIATVNDESLERTEEIYKLLDEYFVKQGVVEPADVTEDPILMSERFSLYFKEMLKSNSPFKNAATRALILYRREHKTRKENDLVLLLRLVMDTRSAAANNLRLDIQKIVKGKSRVDAFRAINASQKKEREKRIAEAIARNEKITDDTLAEEVLDKVKKRSEE